MKYLTKRPLFRSTSGFTTFGRPFVAFSLQGKKVLSTFNVILLALLLVSTGCKEKKQSEDIIAHKQEVKKPSAPISMQSYADSAQVQWVGRSYTIKIRRTADDSLQMVKDETGQKFVDNRIQLRIIRSDGSVFFTKSFTKSNFTAYIDDKYQKEGILEGFVFDKVDDNKLVFAASVCLPQTDEYIPLVVSVDNFGNVSTKLDDSLDTSGDNSEEEEV